MDQGVTQSELDSKLSDMEYRLRREMSDRESRRTKEEHDKEFRKTENRIWFILGIGAAAAFALLVKALSKIL